MFLSLSKKVLRYVLSLEKSVIEIRNRIIQFVKLAFWLDSNPVRRSHYVSDQSKFEFQFSRIHILTQHVQKEDNHLCKSNNVVIGAIFGIGAILFWFNAYFSLKSSIDWRIYVKLFSNHLPWKQEDRWDVNFWNGK